MIVTIIVLFRIKRRDGIAYTTFDVQDIYEAMLNKVCKLPYALSKYFRFLKFS